MSNYNNVKEWRRKNKLRLVQGFGGRCGICGVVDDEVVYDFHHMDPSKKDFTITSHIRSWETVTIEIKKCVMLCAPCHRKHHKGILSIPDDIQLFDESLIERVEIFTHNECPVCDQSKRIRQITCSPACARKKNRKLDWDQIDIEKLIQEKGSMNKAAIYLGISWNGLNKRLKRLKREGQDS